LAIKKLYLIKSHTNINAIAYQCLSYPLTTYMEIILVKKIFLSVVTLGFMLIQPSIWAAECSQVCQQIFNDCSAQGPGPEACQQIFNEGGPPSCEQGCTMSFVECSSECQSAFQVCSQKMPTKVCLGDLNHGKLATSEICTPGCSIPSVECSSECQSEFQHCLRFESPGVCRNILKRDNLGKPGPCTPGCSMHSVECSSQCQSIFQKCLHDFSREQCHKYLNDAQLAPPKICTSGCRMASVAAMQNPSVMPALNFKAFPGDGTCEEGYTLATPQEVSANPQSCHALGIWYIARLADGGSMDGPGYRCQVRDNDERKLGHSLCKKQ